ncbi:MAG: hypothetical protein K2W96_03865 [Gemmataceae bacterium]|nr:hypothetical protein [Gemmataceae bacterium]
MAVSPSGGPTRWKAVAALLVSAAIIAGSVALYRNRAALFRPDLERSGGTRLVLRMAGDPEGVAEALRKRFDPKGMGAVAASAEGATVRLDIPAGRGHDALVERAERLAARPDRVWAGILADAKEDAEAAALAVPGKGMKAGGHEYAWASISERRAARQGGGRRMGRPPPAGNEPGAVSAPWPGGGGWHVLVRKAGAGQGIGCEDLAQVVEEGGPQLTLRLLPESRARLADLARPYLGAAGVTGGGGFLGGVPSRRLGVMLDGDALLLLYLADTPDLSPLFPLLEGADRAKDAAALLRHPYPAGTTAEIVERIEFPAR